MFLNYSILDVSASRIVVIVALSCLEALELNDKMLQGFYQLQQQYPGEMQMSRVSHRHQLTRTDFLMPVFSDVPPKIPFGRLTTTRKRHRYRPVSIIAFCGIV